jgi:hypothetical protein
LPKYEPIWIESEDLEAEQAVERSIDRNSWDDILGHVAITRGLIYGK